LAAAVHPVPTTEGLTALTPSFLLSLLLVVVVVAITTRLQVLVAAQVVAALGRAARAALALRGKAIMVAQANPLLVKQGMVVAEAAAVLVL
jgi:hypothetical protein